MLTVNNSLSIVFVIQNSICQKEWRKIQKDICYEYFMMCLLEVYVHIINVYCKINVQRQRYRYALNKLVSAIFNHEICNEPKSARLNCYEEQEKPETKIKISERNKF